MDRNQQQSDTSLNRVNSTFQSAPSRVLMTHSVTIHPSPVANQYAMESLQNRTAEGVMQIRDNFSNVVRNIHPIMARAQSLSVSGNRVVRNLFNRSAPDEVNAANSSSNGNFVINLDNIGVVGNEPTQDNLQNVVVNNQINNIPEDGSNNGAGAAADEIPADNIPTTVEAQQFLRVISQYVPFVIILFAKGLYDHHEGILNFLVLMVTFAHSNSVVKREATKRSRRNLTKLLLAFLYINICILFIHYIFEEEHLYLNLIFIRNFEKPLNVWDLLWIVGLTDFILKLITVMLKILVTVLPGTILPFQKRGKVYLFMEATSQLYRSLAPIQPWLYYLLESYQGTEKIIGVFLSAAYMVSKGSDLVSKIKLMKMAVLKLLENVAVGSSPSKEQIQTAGEHCPICHDDYDSPVLLQCRHIFCESCVTTWFDREQTCPLCRAKIVDDPSWRDGSTTFFMQLF